MKIDPNAFFREVTLLISSSLDVDEVLASLFDYFKDIFPIDGLALHYIEHGGTYSLGRAGDMPSFVIQDKNLPMMSVDPKIREDIDAETKKRGFFVGDVILLNQPWPKFFKEIVVQVVPQLLDMPSLLNLRLSIKDEELGELSLVSFKDNIFTRDHADLLQTVKEPISIAMSNARRFQELSRLKDILADDYRSMRQELETISGNQVIGAEFGLRQVMEMVHQVAPLNNPVLLLGETGTGKEVIANAIHLASSRRDKPLIRVQCGAIPDTLLDSELFGHEKGAFTGAISMKRGRFERADGGTIFLDEIGELTLDAQVKLLRVLQEHEIERLGGAQTIKVDVRVIAATHRNLEDMVKKGLFREDLWYRLNVFPVHLPPLRARKEDIPMLVVYFINRKAREIGMPDIPRMAPGALQDLESYEWPGNVRELQNVVERALITCTDNVLRFPYLTGAVKEAPIDATPESSPKRIDPMQQIGPLNEIIAEHIRLAMSAARGKVEGRRGAAAMLHMNPSTLRAKMRKLGISFGRDVEDF